MNIQACGFQLTVRAAAFRVSHAANHVQQKCILFKAL